MLRRIHVGDNERVFLIRDGRFETILEPGSHVILAAGIHIERHNIKELAVKSDWRELIVLQHPELAAKHFVIVDTGDEEVAIVSFDGNVRRVIGPWSRAFYWKGSCEIKIVLLNILNDREVPCGALPTV